MPRSSVRSTIATPITPSNRSAISSTRPSSFFQNKSSVPFAGEGFCSAKLLPNSTAVTATIIAPIRVIRSRDCRALRLIFFERTLEREPPRRIEVRERLFQLFQLGSRPVHFDVGEISHLHRLGQEHADILKMREEVFCIFVGFMTKKCIAIHCERVEKTISLSLLNELRQHRLNLVDLSPDES